jgi:phospholipid/cholesterol/gamma-HCH transport system substrate-binding protein
LARVLTTLALVVAILAAGVLMFRADSGYEVDLTLDTAGQLVKGNQVKVGGVPVGEVREIVLDDDSRARLTLALDDEDLQPLHQGTKATVRQTSLSGIANRYIALTPGPNDAPEIEDGGEIPPEDAEVPVDLDLVLNTLGPATQSDLRGLVRGTAGAIDGRSGKQLNAALLALNPALSQTALTERELLRDQESLERFILKSADVVTALASRRPDLEQAVPNALAATGALARRSESLESALERLPGTLRQTNTTLVNLRAAIGDIRPAVREARPAAPLLSEFLTRLRPLARDARPVVARLRRVIDRSGSEHDLLGVLRRLPALERAALPALASATSTVQELLPILGEVRPYTPDYVGGLLNGFGGATGIYYDANGRYARISLQSSVYSAEGAGSLVPLPQAQQGLTGYRKGVDKRCPGAATQTHPDGSNPYIERDGFPCEREDSPE